MTDATTQQPQPKRGQDVVLLYVVEDMRQRAEMGKAQYGTYLETFNGRDMLWDAYTEALDMCMYLRGAILERDAEQRFQQRIKELAK